MWSGFFNCLALVEVSSPIEGVSDELILSCSNHHSYLCVNMMSRLILPSYSMVPMSCLSSNALVLLVSCLSSCSLLLVWVCARASFSWADTSDTSPLGT